MAFLVDFFLMNSEKDDLGNGREPHTDSTLDITSQQLASVRLLLSSERDVAIHDLLLATSFEYLDFGARTGQEIAAHLASVWPGIRHSRHAIDQIMQEAQRANYVKIEEFRGSLAVWAIAERGRLDLEGSRKWARDVLDRTEAQLRRAVIDFFGSAEFHPLGRWTEILIESISASLKEGFSSDPSKIDIVNNLLIPAEVDIRIVDAHLKRFVKDDNVRDFLRTVARSSLDPASDLGSELVHHLTLGYILHAFAAGFDNREARKSIGSLRNEVFILDTPVLLQLSGPRTLAESVTAILCDARDKGVRIIVLHRTMEELQKVLDARSEEADAIEQDLQRYNLEIPHLLASISDQVLQMWLSCEPEGGTGWLSWSTYRERCARTTTTIQALGGEIGVAITHSDHGSHSRFERALNESLEERGRSRGYWQISHDAEMLTSLKILRSENPADGTKMWPGAVIVSPDTHLVDSYRGKSTSSSTEFPAAITVGQWAAILAKCSDPATAEGLAKVLSSEVSSEAALNRAVTVPLETALQIARSLKGASVSDISLGAIGICIDDILASEPEVDQMSPAMAQELAAQVLAQRHARLERITQEQREAAARERQEAEKHRVRREAQVEEREKGHREAAKQDRKRASELETKITELEKEVAQERTMIRTQSRRMFAATFICLFVLSATIVTFVSGAVGTRGLVVGSIGTIILSGLSIDWYKNNRSWYEIVVPTIVNGGWLLLESILSRGS